MPRFKKLLVYLFPLIIIAVSLCLALQNFQPKTYLVGWDSLHSEFNFQESIVRAVFGVWREDQGVGTLAIHSHMADLPRIITLWLMSQVLPLNLLRYVYISLTLVIGPLGVFYLLKYVFYKRSEIVSSASAFLGALYYLFNLGTLQHLYVPFEMFNVAFAFIPWLFLVSIRYLQENSNKNLIWFAVLNVLAAPMAYAATLYYAYFAAVVVFLVFYNLLLHKKDVLKRSVIIIFVSVLMNMYWILPNVYSIYKSSSDVSKAKINVLFSPEAFLRNKSYGTVKDVLIHKNFLFEWRAFDFKTNQFEDLLSIWNLHFNSFIVTEILYLVALVALLGVLTSVVKLDKLTVSFLGIGLLSLFFLFNANGLTGGVYRFLYNNLELFKEGLRTPFTKFSIPFMLVMAYFFGYFFNFFLSLFKNKIISVVFIFFTILITSGSLIYALKPAFAGHLIGDLVKREIPSEYFKLFSWFESNQSGRVALLPLNTQWGWDYNSWGYQGSGFLGFGIKNPLLIRDYDRWSPHNETFYLQASKALYDQSPNDFKNILDKYQVKYLVLDESIINAGGSSEFLRINDIKNTLGALSFKEVFKSGFLTVYDTGIQVNNFVRPLNTYKAVNTNLKYSPVDPVYEKYGDYILSEEGLGLPFTNLDVRSDVQIATINGSIQFKNTKTGSTATFPIENELSETFAPDHGFADANNCDLKKKGEVKRIQQSLGRTYKAFNGGVSCDYFVFDNLEYKNSYLLKVKGQNVAGRSLKIYLYNWASKRVELEELLPSGEFESYFVIYPKVITDNTSADSKQEEQNEKDITSGYTLNVETRSFGKVSSENYISEINFILFDIDLLTNLYIDTDNNNIMPNNNLEVSDVKKWGTAFYKVEVSGPGIFQLGQGYEDGWVAVTKTDEGRVKQLKHLNVNGWSNGWEVTDGGDVYVIFWPQLLQYLGFVLMLLTGVVLIVKSR